ncbi:cupin domain-containing protein [Lutispora saccharofermentans]|uniref:Cupin domain-containing protein n=1 Tax=Lutispora saccharofermentans TaxID=3024236 RepID=A0ABT1NC10_9FIRM|nr:cupin domain-containing protein [Lutispora saccharofermentans]MCQ1528169.1 cupin domain-containing protein [Lutispora saccharofermentans]
MSTIIRNQESLEWIRNPKHRDVFLRHLATSKENDRLSAHIVKIEKDGEIVPHTHEILEVFYIMKGEGLVLANGERVKAAAGDCIIAHPGEEHGLINTGEGEILLYAVFSPANC